MDVIKLLPLYIGAAVGPLGFAVYGLGASMGGLLPNLWTLLASRIFQGIEAGFLTPVIMALIGEIDPERHVGKAMGIFGLAYAVGVTLGPLNSGLTEVRYGWPWFFYFLTSIALGAGTLYAVSRDTKHQERESNLESLRSFLF